jgi:hypothetical protein
MGWGRARGEASLRHCGRNLYVSGWGGGGLEGKAAYGTAVRFFYISSSREEKGCRHRRRTLTVEKHRISTLIVHLHITSLIRYLGQISSEVA